VKKIKVILLIFSFLAIMAESVYAEEVTIIYSGQTHSALYPCNCPIRQDGGISRRATLVKELRKKYPGGLLLLDCGNFTAGGRMDENSQNIHLDMQRSEVNYKALELMQYDAVGVGPEEFNFGREFFLRHAKKTYPAYLSANLDSDKVVPYLIKDCYGVKLAVIGLTGTSAKQKAEGLEISPPAGGIARLVSRLKQEGAQVVVLLSTLGEKEDLKLISEVKGIDIIFTGYHPQKEEALTKIGGAFLLRPSWQGRRLGKLTLKIKDGKLIDCRLEELPLTEEISDDPQITAILPLCYSDADCKNKESAQGTCLNPGALKAACVFTKPNKVNLSVISVKGCRVCNPGPVLDSLKNKFPGLAVKNLDYPDAAAKALIKKLSISTLPAFIFEKKVEQEDNFDNLKKDLQLTDNFYVLKAQASGIAYFLNQQAKPGNLDLFFSIFQKDTSLLLTVLREFNPVLHFLVTEKDKNFDAQGGLAEVEESLRAVCVQKYYPKESWDYLICRSKNIHSSYWEDCLSGLAAQSVKTCARGAEGIELLRENTNLNKQLQISNGPSYLLDNREIFASRRVPNKEELRKILKRQKE
jgi:hypothetical protein